MRIPGSKIDAARRHPGAGHDGGCSATLAAAAMPAYGLSNGYLTDESDLLDGPVPAGVLEVPDFLLLPLAKVKGEIRKAMRKVAKGANLAELLDEHPLLDLATEPDSVVRLWYSGKTPRRKLGVPIEVAGVHDAYWGAKGLDIDSLYAIRDDYLMAYLTSSAWGALVLNCKGSTWLSNAHDGKYEMHPDHMATTLEATIRHWDVLNALGRRFTSLGGGVRTFAAAATAADGILRVCGHAPDEFVPVDQATVDAYPHIRPEHMVNLGAARLPELCADNHIIERLRTDPDFRRRASTFGFEREYAASRVQALQKARERHGLA